MIDNIMTILWNRRDHHDNLVHTRLNWLLLTQAFLSAVFFSVYGKTNLDTWIVLSVPVIGLFSTLAVYVSIIRGVRAYGQLREQIHKAIDYLKNANYQQDEGLDYRWTTISVNSPRSWDGIRYIGFFPVWLLPPLFFAFWVALFSHVMWDLPLPWLLWVALFSFLFGGLWYAVLTKGSAKKKQEENISPDMQQQSGKER